MNLRVRNYQSIKDANLLIEGLTIVRGPSNAGKSSLLKALYAATNNRFRRGCVTFGEDECVVSVKFTGEDKILTVSRSALGASPRVKLGNKAQGYLTFNKLNRDLPKEVQDYCNYGFIAVTTQEKYPLNFCMQFSLPLMVRFSNKRIVEILSYSKATDDANKAKKWLDERNLTLRGEFNAMQATLNETKNQLGKLQQSLQLYSDKDILDSIMASVSTQQSKIDALSQLYDCLTKQQVLINKVSAQAQILEVLHIIPDSEGYQQLLTSLVSMQTFKEKLIHTESVLTSLHTISDTDTLFKLQSLVQKDDYLTNKCSSLTTVICALQGITETSTLINLMVVLNQNEDLVNQCKEADYAYEHLQCPICGTKLT